jgi:hypothetical protein
MLEREVIEKFHQLDSAAQKRVREIINQETNSDEGAAFDYDQWFREVEAIRQEIRSTNEGRLPSVDVVGILRDIRDGEDE